MPSEQPNGAGVAVYRSKRKRPLRGKDRKGIRSADLRRDMTDAIAKYVNSPMVDKPRVLVETMRIVGDDCLTAQDQALYEALLATARDQGMDAEQHSVPLSDAMRFLDVRRPARVAESLERLTRTVVRYDFRDEERRRYGAMPLVLAEIEEDLRSGAAAITFAIPEPVRKAVLAAVQYTWLEINSFAQFSCRYTSRLYQRLALRAGQDGGLNKRWEIEPTELARLLQFPVPEGGLHYATFRRRCLEPCMRDIEDHVTRFKSTLEEVRGDGRGRPVARLAFVVTESSCRIEEVQAARTSHALSAYHRRPDPVLSDNDLPSRLAIGKAVARTGMSEIELSDGWRAALEKARENPQAQVSGMMQGAYLLDSLRRANADVAFLCWATAVHGSGDKVDTSRRAVPPPPPASPRLPDGERERRKADAIHSASSMTDHIDGWAPMPRGREAERRTLKSRIETRAAVANCAADLAPWAWFALPSFEDECGAAARQLPRAFGALRRMPEAQARRSVRNLFAAVAEWDMDRLARTAKAIAAEAGCLPPAPPPHPVRRSGHAWTEANAGEYHDPLFVAGEGGWDDRPAADFEEAVD